MDIFWMIICLVFTAYFSSLIVAYTYSNKIFINLESKKENITSYTLKVLSENPRLYISSLKAANTISLVIFSFYFLSFCKEIYPEIHFSTEKFSLIAIFIAWILVYLFSKFIPQTIVKPYANQFLIQSNLPVKIIILVLKPITNPLLKISDWFLKSTLNLSQDKNNQLLSISELGSYITKQIETVEKKEKLDTELQILKNALSFSDVLVKKVMIPKIEIESVSNTESIENVKTKFTETGYSRLLVYENSEDNIIGYIHIFEILEKPNSIQKIIYPIETVSENSLIKDLFKRLSVKGKAIAKVVDDNGNLTGIITMEDIIEELFGEIDDEYDEKTQVIEKRIAPNKFIFSCKLDVGYINKKFNLNFSETEDYETIGAYILKHTNKIPKKGTLLKIEHYQFKILSASDKKIEIVEVTTS